MQKERLVIVGPFLSEYSLARVNRGLGVALFDKYDVFFYDNEHNDSLSLFESKYAAKHAFLKDKILEALEPKENIVIFNNFPKDVQLDYGLEHINAKMLLPYIAWEESKFPRHLIQEINKYAHGVLATSTHVQKVFRDSGLKLPIINIGEGIDINSQMIEDAKRLRSPIKSTKAFKFLHVSSGHYRKGIDVLLQAYAKAFNNTDDVVLVIKSFANHDNLIADLIAKYLSSKESPEVELIENNYLTDAEMINLYQNANCMVLPTRGEGFGLPMLESMAVGLPLITTGYSGHMDFCDNSNSMLIDFELQDSKSHLQIPGAQLAEPNINQLVDYMQKIFESGTEADWVKLQTENAKCKADTFTWKEVVSKFEVAKQAWHIDADLKTKKAVLISPYNGQEGISESNKYKYDKVIGLYGEFNILANELDSKPTHPDNDNVYRTWCIGDLSVKATIGQLAKLQPDHCYIEHHVGQMQSEFLKQILIYLDKEQINTILTLHIVREAGYAWASILSELQSVQQIVVHNLKDKLYLQNLGLSNVEHLNLGLQLPLLKRDYRDFLNIDENKFIVATHGLIHDRKGYLELIEGFARFVESNPKTKKNADLWLLTAVNPDNPTSVQIYNQMSALIEKHKLDVVLVDEFISTEEVFVGLSVADVCTFVYNRIPEGASEAVRKAISLKKPVITSTSPNFDEIDCGIKIDVDGDLVKQIAEVLTEVYNDRKKLSVLAEQSAQFTKKIDWNIHALEFVRRVAK